MVGKIGFKKKLTDMDWLAPRLLGAMFLIVIIVGVLSGFLLSPLNYEMTGPPEDSEAKGRSGMGAGRR